MEGILHQAFSLQHAIGIAVATHCQWAFVSGSLDQDSYMTKMSIPYHRSVQVQRLYQTAKKNCRESGRHIFQLGDTLGIRYTAMLQQYYRSD